MEFRKTQLGCVLEQIKLAVASHTPIVYIPTNQVELIWDILYNSECVNSIVPRKDSVNDQFVDSGNLFKKGIDGNMSFIKDNYSEIKPSQSSIVVPDYTKNPQLTYSFADDFKYINSSLFAFVCRYNGVKFDSRNISSNLFDNIRRSVWIVVTPQKLPIPANIAPYVKTVDVPALKDEEIIEILLGELERKGIGKEIVDENLLDQMKVNLRGLSSKTIVNIINQLVSTHTIDNDFIEKAEVLDVIRAEKKQMLSGIPGLKWEKVEKTDAAGLEMIADWLEERKEIFEDTERALRNHRDIPKGILVSGVPGSGKSLMAKTAAYKLNLPLISLDMGDLLGGIMGQSEHNMINALEMADKMAPCVLWIDEIEKAFSGSSKNSSASDGGVGRRMFGKFLTWMQEKKSSCFVFATSNDISCLPPELFRSERFDRKYFTFMPMAEDCAKIFVANIKAQEAKYKRELDGMPDEMKREMPGTLFSENLQDTATWLKVLNECCTSDLDGCTLIKKEKKDRNGEIVNVHLWKNGKRPINKLFTGADISAIIKEAKFRVSRNEKYKNKNCVYDGDAIINEVKSVISQFQPYGETNLHDIVRCFRSLFENRFESAATGCVVNFYEYDDDTQIYDVSESELADFKHKYDKVLFSTVVGAINYYSNDKKKEEI